MPSTATRASATWLRQRPRFVLHFIPTRSSWFNLIERWFAELEQKAVRRGVLRSAEELQQAIDQFLAVWDDEPVPYASTASIDRILAKVERCRSPCRFSSVVGIAAR